MAYTVLARRYRSGTFDEVIGQDHVAQTLKKAIASGRIAHAYLFCGTRGTGKTSMARILAKALNCRSSDQPTTTPCGTCESCVAISRGDDIDVIEIDAASNTGVDNVREVIENSQYRPAASRFKIYIIDEAHMLSKAAFNALLKTLEEPPSHVKFILATTEPEKLLPTILSRCQRYDFRNIPTREIAAHLADICKREKIEADEEALLLVAKAGAGSMRDSLSLLDRLLSVGEKHLTAEMIEGMLGLPKSQLLFDLAEAIGAGEVKAALQRANAIVQGGLSADSLIAALVEHLRNLLILRTCGADETLVEVPGLSMAELMKQASRFDPGVLAQDITILEELRRTLRQSQAGRALLDATLVRLALAEQFASIGELLGQLDGGGPAPGTARPAAQRSAPTPAAPPAQKKNLEPVDDAAFQPGMSTQAESGRPVAAMAPELHRVAADAAAVVAAAQRATVVKPPSPVAEVQPVAVGDLAGCALADATTPVGESVLSPAHPSAEADDAQNVESAAAVEDDDDALPAVGKVWSGPSESLSTLMAKHRAAHSTPAVAEPAAAPAPQAPAAPQGGNVEAIDPTNLPGLWQAMLGILADHGPMLHSLVSQGQLVAIADGQAVIRFGPQQETFVRQWERNGKRDLIRDAASQALQQNIGVRFEIDENAASAVPSAPAPAASTPAPARRAAPLRPAPTPAPEVHAPPETASIKVTNELVDSLAQSNPLIKSVLQTFGAQVIKVE